MPSLPQLGSSRLPRVGASAYQLRFAQPLSTIVEGTNASLLLTRSAASGGLGSYTSVNSSEILDEQQQLALQSIAFATSALSLAVAIIAVYWFWMMRRSFRRDLILLLIFGGIWKSLWFVIFGAVEFAKGRVRSHSSFCFATGYMLEVGFEACDVAILFMSVHMYLQIFPPARSIFAHDGLYHVRYWVFALWIILPNICASLAFINPDTPYESVAGFCFLPIRPFWYRLALFWIPRYLIWIFIVYVVVRIYRHVGTEFKVFGQEKEEDISLDIPGQSTVDRAEQQEEEEAELRREKKRRMTEPAVRFIDRSETHTMFSPVGFTGGTGLSKHQEDDSVSPDSLAKKTSSPPDRRFSMPVLMKSKLATEDSTADFAASKSQPASRRESRHIRAGVSAEDFAPPSESATIVNRESIPEVPSLRSSLDVTGERYETPAFVQESQTESMSTGLSVPRGMAGQVLQQRRRAIQRQLRLLFIYPIVYMLVWIMPSVSHFMNYSNYWAQHPVFALNVIQTFCLTIMTYVDVVIFCWRERPWRHIPGSDGTFVGSFCFWRFVRKDEWRVERRESRAPSYVRKPSEGGRARPSLAGTTLNSNTGPAGTFKHWSQVSWSGKTSIAGSSEQTRSSVHEGPPNSKPNPPPSRPRVHYRDQGSGSDQQNLETQRAYERLALERAEYAARKKKQNRRVQILSEGSANSTEASRKDWFDHDLFNDLEDVSGLASS